MGSSQEPGVATEIQIAENEVKLRFSSSALLTAFQVLTVYSWLVNRLDSIDRTLPSSQGVLLDSTGLTCKAVLLGHRKVFL